MYSNITGYNNVAIGFNSLYSNTTGYYNTALGYQSLYSNTTGQDNVAIGYQSLYSNTGSYNTAVGASTLYSNTTGQYNAALGYKTLYSNTTGQQNTAIGQESLYSNTTGQQNTAVGYQSLVLNTSGVYNTAIGFQSLLFSTTGDNNTAIGYTSLFSNTTGANNTTLGLSSLYSNTTGYLNTVIGYNSMYSNITGYSNVAIGAISNSNFTNISNSVFIGVGASSQSDSQSNQIVIGYNAQGAGSNTVVIGDGNIIRTYLKGSVVIADGTQGAGKILTSNSNGLASWINPISFVGATGPQGVTGSGSKYSATSSTTFTTPEVGFMRTIQTQTNLAYTQDQWVIISSNSDFGEDEYYEEFTSPLFYAKVDDYSPTTGVLNVISEYSVEPGLTFSKWFINLSGANSPGTTGSTGATGSVLLPYKVYTALLTQSGGSSFQDLSFNGSDPLPTISIGTTYQITQIGPDIDFTLIGSLDNNVGTYFMATGTYAGNGNPASPSVLNYNIGAPVATVLENTIGNIWFTYESIGTYNIMSNASFTNNKTYCSTTLSNYNYDSSNVMLGRVNDSIVQMITLLPTDSHYDGSNTSIEIRVYN